MAIGTALFAAAMAGLATAAGAATVGPHIYGNSGPLPMHGAHPFATSPLDVRPFASSNTLYVFGDTVAASQWISWLAIPPVGCYVATNEALSDFVRGAPAARSETISRPQIANCANNKARGPFPATYSELDIAAHDVPLSTAENTSYHSSSVFLARGPTRVAPVAGMSLSEAYNTKGLPGPLAISNTQLCEIWKGTLLNWDAVTNQATGKPAMGSLPLCRSRWFIVRTAAARRSFTPLTLIRSARAAMVRSEPHFRRATPAKLISSAPPAAGASRRRSPATAARSVTFRRLVEHAPEGPHGSG